MLAAWTMTACIAMLGAYASLPQGPAARNGETATGSPQPSAPTAVFTSEEIAQCGTIRIPEMTITPSRIILVAQCRDANVTALNGHPTAASEARLGDNMLNAKVVTKHSSDGGLTWHNWTVLTPISYSHGAVVYDAVRKQVVLQYQHHSSADPEMNSTLYQRISTDDGATWGRERNINSEVASCNPLQPDQMQVQSAGSKIQTSWGRIIFTGHNSANQSCVWWTDDGGTTYSSTKPFLGNEISVAELSGGSSVADESLLVLSGRGLHFPWAPNRTQYYSHDGGASWTTPQPSQLLDNSIFGCEAALIAVGKSGSDTNRTLFSSEPVNENRSGLVVRCSLDGGRTWPGSLQVNGDNPAAYSALLQLESGSSSDSSSNSSSSNNSSLLVVWESGHGFIATRTETGWCSP